MIKDKDSQALGFIKNLLVGTNRLAKAQEDIAISRLIWPCA